MMANWHGKNSKERMKLYEEVCCIFLISDLHCTNLLGMIQMAALHKIPGTI